MTEFFEVYTFIPGVTAERIYRAWLDSKEHGDFTGGEAEIDPQIGGRFTAWDGYIQGTNLILEPGRRIVQAWRTTEFPIGSPDSRLELVLEDNPEGVRVTLLHSDIPDGQGEDYRQGWDDHYFKPMLGYFSKLEP
jgi:activator of HSP90 ATPase